MVGLYFSGTGNTRWCTEQFLQGVGGESHAVSMESPEAEAAIRENQDILVAYPVYYSSLPKIVADYLEAHGERFRGKRVFLLATMGLFSGDGAGCGARLLKRYGAQIAGGLHLKMPDCIADEKALKRPLEENRRLVREAGEKARTAAEQWKRGTPPREGLGLPSQLAGLLGQRLWFSGKTKRYSDALKVNTDLCTGCGACVKHCPMGNLRLREGKAGAGGQCTLCYRCVNQCPARAITLLGRRVWEQCRIERYLGE